MIQKSRPFIHRNARVSALFRSRLCICFASSFLNKNTAVRTNMTIASIFFISRLYQKNLLKKLHYGRNDFALLALGNLIHDAACQ